MSDAPRDVRGLTREATPTRVPAPTRRWRSRWLLPIALATATVGLLLYANWDQLRQTTAVRAVAVIVKAMADSAPGTVTVQAPGWLEPAPHPHFVAALTPGVIDELLVLEGQAVEKDEIVARLIDDDARLARDRAAAAADERRAAVLSAEAELAAARETLETLIDLGEGVERAAATVAAVDAKRRRLDADIQAAAAVASATQDEFDRKAPLAATQAVSRGEVERLRLRLDADRASADAARAGIPVLEAEKRSAVAQLDAARQRAELRIEERRAVALGEARLDAARAALARAEAELAEAALRLARTEVRAANAGIVMSRLVAPGSEVGMRKDEHASHVVHLYDPDQLQVRVDVPLADASQVGVDQPAQVVVEALPDRVFEGVVTRLVHEADIAKNTVEVKVAVRDPVATLKPEMLARVRFLAHEPPPEERAATRQRIFAPEAALRRSGSDAEVFVVADASEGRGRAERRTVQVGTRTIDGHVEVLSGLRPGDLVVVEAPADLANGTHIEINGGAR